MTPEIFFRCFLLHLFRRGRSLCGNCKRTFRVFFIIRGGDLFSDRLLIGRGILFFHPAFQPSLRDHVNPQLNLRIDLFSRRHTLSCLPHRPDTEVLVLLLSIFQTSYKAYFSDKCCYESIIFQKECQEQYNSEVLYYEFVFLFTFIPQRQEPLRELKSPSEEKKAE